MTELFTSENLIALLTLASLEIVLGIDNIVFIAILTAKLPQEKRALGRNLGLIVAMLSRLVLLGAITWIMRLEKPWFTVLAHDISGRDLILIVGGLFLLAKATFEIHAKVEGKGHDDVKAGAAKSFASVITQIMILDIVFSLDSVITAVGMVDSIAVMVVAVVLAVLVMLIFSGPIARFIESHPTMKMLALSFLLLVGVVLVAEGLGQHIQKGYIYFAMAFSLFVELLNLRAKKSVPAKG